MVCVEFSIKLRAKDRSYTCPNVRLKKRKYFHKIYCNSKLVFLLCDVIVHTFCAHVILLYILFLLCDVIGHTFSVMWCYHTASCFCNLNQNLKMLFIKLRGKIIFSFQTTVVLFPSYFDHKISNFQKIIQDTVELYVIFVIWYSRVLTR